MDISSPLPLFPLPNVLLYPEAILPLHVFEPRYVQMVEDLRASGSDGIVLGLLAQGWQEDYFGDPAVHPVAGLGKILNTKRAESGRYNLLVQGVRRVRVSEEVQSDRLYRTVRVTPVEEILGGSDRERERINADLRNELIEFADGSLILRANASLGYMADLLTVALPLGMERKQELFRTLDVFQRAQGVLAEVHEINRQRRALRAAKGGPDVSRWN